MARLGVSAFRRYPQIYTANALFQIYFNRQIDYFPIALTVGILTENILNQGKKINLE